MLPFDLRKGGKVLHAILTLFNYAVYQDLRRYNTTLEQERYPTGPLT